MLEAFYPHEQPLDHGCRMHHAHFLGGTPHVGLFPVKDSLHQQPIQDSVNIPYSSPPVPHPPSHLHPGEPDEVPEMEVAGLVVVQVFPLAINPLDQGVSGSIRACVHGHAVGRASICHPGHTSDCALAIPTRHVVVVEVVTWHDGIGD